MCKVNGCDNDSAYVKDDVCQMHYFRFMRNGTYDTVRKRNYRYTNPKGYQAIYEPDHILSQKNGYVYEHRFVMYSVFGDNLPDCALCGKECNWDLYTTHIDHIDEDVTNNKPDNLRSLCNACNTGRGKKEQYLRSTSIAIKYKDEIKTPAEWSRHDQCTVTGSTITRRFRSGLSAEDSIFLPSKTFKS